MPGIVTLYLVKTLIFTDDMVSHDMSWNLQNIAPDRIWGPLIIQKIRKEEGDTPPLRPLPHINHQKCSSPWKFLATSLVRLPFIVRSDVVLMNHLPMTIHKI